MPSRPKGGPRLEDVTLGIDLGSYSTRAALRTATGSEFVIENKESMIPDNSYYAADFSSTIYPFDHVSQPVYPLNPDHSRRTTSAKYAFYVLAYADDELLEEYAVAQQLTNRQNDPAFRKQLRRGIVGLLAVVRDAAMTVCRSRRYRIAKIGLSIPVQWTSNFEDVYRDVLFEAFKGEIEKSNMAFYAETETFGRYSYKFHSREIDPEDKHSSIMCFDFGGHNMNCCLFGVARDFNQQVDNSFFTVGKPSGVGGGSELWEYHTVRWVVTRYFTKTKMLPDQEQLRKVFADFQAIKGQDEQNWGKTCYFDLPDGTAWKFPLSKETINDAWEKGLGRPLRLMKRQLARLVALQKKDRISSPLVMVSGGSARGPKARACIEALCKEAGVTMIFTDKYLSVNYRTAQIALAAAYVASETITAEEFFLRGAAVGLQRCSIGPRSQAQNIAWDSWGPLLLDGVNATPDQYANKVDAALSRIRRHPGGNHGGFIISPELKVLQRDMPLEFITTTGRDRFRLICDPFFVQRPPPHKPEVHANRSYDLAYLGEKAKGTWAFLATFTGSDDDLELHLHQWRMPSPGQPWARQKTIRMPLYSEGSCNCVTVGADGYDVNDLIKDLDLGLPPQPQEDPEDEPQETEECRDEEARVVSDIVDAEPSAAVVAKPVPVFGGRKLLTPGPIRAREDEKKRLGRAIPYQRPQRDRRPSSRLSESQ